MGYGKKGIVQRGLDATGVSRAIALEMALSEAA
jgi:hypothetical protein